MTTKTATKKSVKKKAPQKESTARKTDKNEPDLQIIQTSKCQTVSNKSTLTYNIALDDKNQVYIRIIGNTGGGYFSNEWISLDNITSILSDVPADHTITSINLIPLFKGKSVNTPGYLLAALVSEGLLSANQEKKRHYAYSGTEKLLAKVAKKAK